MMALSNGNCCKCPEDVKHFYASSLPTSPCKNSIYFIKSGSDISMYVTDSQANIFPISGSGEITDISIISPNSTILVSKLGNEFNIDVNGVLGELNLIDSITYNGTPLTIIGKNVNFQAVQTVSGNLVDFSDPYNPIVNFSPEEYSLEDFINPLINPFLRAEDLINEHNNLQNIQGGALTERYHLTQDEHTYLTNIVQDDIIGEILDLITISPTYIAPTSSLNESDVIAEQGSIVAVNLTQIFIQNDAGTKIAENIVKNDIIVSATNTYSESLVLNSPTIYSGTVSFAEGVTKNNNLGLPDPTGKILPGTVNSPNKTYTPLLPFFYGVFSTSQNLNTLDLSGMTKQVTSSTGNISAVVNASNQYIVIAIPNSSPVKSKWYITELNQGVVGGTSNLFGTSVISPKNSPEGYWGGISYRLYQTNYPTTVSTIQLRN